MAVIDIKAPAERKPGPYEARRRCFTCRCYLSRNNPSDQCAPCSGGDWISPDQLSERRELKLTRGRVEGLAA